MTYVRILVREKLAVRLSVVLAFAAALFSVRESTEYHVHACSVLRGPILFDTGTLYALPHVGAGIESQDLGL